MRTRKTSRKTLQALATCRNGVGRQWETLLADVSEGGCKVLDPSEQIRKGERLNLFFAKTGPHIAQVTWRRGEEVGLEFRRSLSEELLQSLASQDWTKTGADAPEGPLGNDLLRYV